ncbi:hypothetical protein G7Y89_g3613 [Cudoniella acicularis]|uniref:Zn(2)-C6 fungal-type domain-containing protein n=1 Tax=Cudoniella acicularis TaxID=354080 RepID=A0A8H4W512_9HELO|nr:hypothetical protein G7Y89_g3613 [Cudoniella acicularis]
MPKDARRNGPSTRRRSKGCDQCRQRRVKCDLKTPTRRQCLRFGFNCSGAIQGSVFIDMVNEVSSLSHENLDVLGTRSAIKQETGKALLRFELDSSVVGLRELSPGQNELESSSDGQKAQFSPRKYIYRDPTTSFTVSVYNAINIIIHSILHLIPVKRMSLSSDLEISHHDLALSHSTSILLMAEYQENNCPLGFEFMRSVFTLKVAAALSPSAVQRAKAMGMMKLWTSKDGVKGVTNKIDMG